MTADRTWRGAVAAAERAGDRRVRARGVVLADELAATLPGVAITADDHAVVLRAPGLRARAFGTRRRAADPGFVGIGRGESR